MRGGGKTAHIGAGFRNQHLGSTAANAGNAYQPLKHCGKRAQGFRDPSADLDDALFKVIDVGEKPPDQKGVMGAKASDQRLPESRQLAAQSSAREFSE